MADDARGVAVKLTKGLETLIKRLTLDATANVIQETPVDTGWARANWLPSVGTPVDAPAGTREGVTSGAQRAGMAEVAASTKLGTTNYVSNNVPYIGTLDEGHSPQAPPGFVEASIQRAIRGLDGVVIE